MKSSTPLRKTMSLPLLPQSGTSDRSCPPTTRPQSPRLPRKICFCMNVGGAGARTGVFLLQPRRPPIQQLHRRGTGLLTRHPLLHHQGVRMALLRRRHHPTNPLLLRHPQLWARHHLPHPKERMNPTGCSPTYFWTPWKAWWYACWARFCTLTSQICHGCIIDHPSQMHHECLRVRIISSSDTTMTWWNVFGQTVSYVPFNELSSHAIFTYLHTGWKALLRLFFTALKWQDASMRKWWSCTTIWLKKMRPRSNWWTML